MALFRSRANTPGWAMYAPLTDGGAWQPASLRSPVEQAGHAVLRQRKGTITRLSKREIARPGDRFLEVDLRRRLIQMHPQTIPTADGMTVTLTLAFAARTVDPVQFITEAQGPDEEIYLAAQIALRELVMEQTLDSFVGTRLELDSVLTAAQSAATLVGAQVNAAFLKDISLPASYSAALQDAVVAKVNSETDLERARNEVKTTRARLASAKVLEQNPVLAKIRMLEALPPGSTIEIRGDQL
ncbi:SPFH domain-containing protein [Corynebacterium lubricantis]|uniref:SPFH domain-containing protein n=1 Tax=Corynebacterium lubricantis TaxID=541095 RepID=UPI00039D6F7E|nr:SPFH domain-containing protein [Corynebacterium lubricantis]